MVKFKEVPKPCLGKGFADYLNGVWTGLVSAEKVITIKYKQLSDIITNNNVR